MCKAQQGILDDLLAEDRGTVLIAIDTDQNEDEALIRDAWRARGLTERVAIAPRAMTEALVQQFGPDIVNPPSAPIVLVTADQRSAELLPRGLKSAEDLSRFIESAR
ncbi:MAG: hypothetical protein QMC79_08040 [Anaerosomatales bacterium]|nr:hypothetical protein [Anaerosomatales bacterium]